MPHSHAGIRASTVRLERHREGRSGSFLKPLSLAVIAAVAASAVTAPAVLGHTTAPPPVNAAAGPAIPASFADMAERVRPAVVYISTQQRVTNVVASGIPPELRQFMERYLEQGFPEGPAQPSPVQGVGSGFLISPDGYVVTNNHVVAGADEVTVKLSDGKEYVAQVRGTDPKTDLALLKIDADRSLPYVAFGDSDATRVGDWVVAVGSPFGLGGTFSAGIVSARGRNINSGPYDDYIQTDASINRGNSGGPLFNPEGRVIGVNTAIFSPTGGNVGIGFAVPAKLAQPVIEQLKVSGHVDRGWLGVQIQDVSDALAEGLQLPFEDGALVAGVEPSSPAARADLHIGDVIRAVDGKPVTGARDLSRAIGARRARASITLNVWRDGAARDVDLTLAAAPAGPSRPQSQDSAPSPEATARIGVEVADLTPQARSRWGLAEDTSGVVIVGVQPASPAAAQHLRPGDVVVQVGRTPVRDAGSMAALVREASRNGDQVVLLVNRSGAERFVAVDIARG